MGALRPTWRRCGVAQGGTPHLSGSLGAPGWPTRHMYVSVFLNFTECQEFSLKNTLNYSCAEYVYGCVTAPLASCSSLMWCGEERSAEQKRVLGSASIWMGCPMKMLGRRGLVHFFSSRLKEGEILIENSSTDVFLHLNRQRFGKNIDEGQNKKKAVAIQKW